MLPLLLAAAAEISNLHFAGDCAATGRTVRIEDGEATSVAFTGLELRLTSPDESGSLACQVTFGLTPPPGFRAGINGVRVRGALEKGADDSVDLTLRGGSPGSASGASQLKSLTDEGDFDVALGGGTLWSDCGEVSPQYSVSLDLSAFHPTGAASSVGARIDGVSFGAVIYRRCPRIEQN